MKELYIIRHAKSSWSDPDLRDLDRPLNKRGQRDAPFMAKMLKGKGVEVDALVSSPARRAHDTALHFAREWKLNANQVHLETRVYEATPSKLLEIVRDFPADWDTVFVFGHNPTLTSFINLFAKEYLTNLPTCGVAHLVSTAADWTQLGNGNTKLEELFLPRQFFPKKG